jgi:hypothetical protein
MLYGTGAMRLNGATGKVEWQRALALTIKDGVVYDTAQLLADVRRIVTAGSAQPDAEGGQAAST